MGEETFNPILMVFTLFSQDSPANTRFGKAITPFFLIFRKSLWDIASCPGLTALFKRGGQLPNSLRIDCCSPVSFFAGSTPDGKPVRLKRTELLDFSGCQRPCQSDGQRMIPAKRDERSYLQRCQMIQEIFPIFLPGINQQSSRTLGRCKLRNLDRFRRSCNRPVGIGYCHPATSWIGSLQLADGRQQFHFPGDRLSFVPG